MASEDESQTPDHHHDEKDWEAHKEIFRVCYIDQNMTRKDAAQHLKEQHGFDATPRQWERKIKQWNFSKYSSREERLSQIAQTGKTIFEVGRPGRRPRGHTDEHGRLHPNEDRNLRRFARREASRSRSRSRSTSFTERTRPQFQQDLPETSSHAITDQTFNLHLGNPTSFHPPSNGFTVNAIPAAGQPEQPVQLHLLQNQQPSPFDNLDDSGLFLTIDDNQYGSSSGQDAFPAFTEELMQLGDPLGGNGRNPSIQFPLQQNTTVNYPLDQAMDVPVDFAQFGMAEDNLPMDTSILNNNNNLMGEQQLYPDTTQMPSDANEMGGSILNSIPVLTFDVVDTDAASTLPTAVPNDFQEIGDINNDGSHATPNSSGPLQNDVMPLVDEYIGAVQAAAMWFVSNQLYGDASTEKLSDNIDQSGRIFKARMEVMLENYAMSQQRALQAMRDRCNKLKKKNEKLEEKINRSTTVTKLCHTIFNWLLNETLDAEDEVDQTA
ncbi:hypothetical protein LTS17_000286 [Exophiala oligosperma]